jgi:hypothetical protein
MLWSDAIPEYVAADTNGKKTKVRVMAGELNGVVAPPPAPKLLGS